MSTTDLHQAAESLLIQPETSEEAEPQDAPEEEVETAEAEAEEIEAEEGDEEEISEAPDDEEEDGSAEESDGDEQPDTYLVKVNGEEKRVTLDDLKRSYSGQEYIQRGMEEAAKTRKEAESLYSELQAQQQQFLQAVQQVQQGGFKAPPKEPDAAMIDTDPIGYMAEKARYDREFAEYQGQQQQFQQMQAQQSEAAQRARQEYMKSQMEMLPKLVPEFGDAEKAPAFREKLARTGIDAYGFTEQEIGSISDARHVQVLADAMRWRELQKAQKKPKEAPKVVKPVGRRQAPEAVQRAKQKAAAKRSGKLEDFASLLLKPNG